MRYNDDTTYVLSPQIFISSLPGRRVILGGEKLGDLLVFRKLKEVFGGLR